MIPFLDRVPELQRLRRALVAREFAVLYGRRRLGKSRLLREVLADRGVYHVADARSPSLQREALARSIAVRIPGFDRVIYRDWAALLDRLADLPDPPPLALDELPALVPGSPELPSILQNLADRGRAPLVVCGSSQAMMMGLVLDASAPLYGRATEIVRLGPLAPRWLGPAFGESDAARLVDHYAAWGGVPRYWELALNHADRSAAVAQVALDPQGPLHDEPGRLLRDDFRDFAVPESILALVGAGCHRPSEIGARLGQATTNLARPLARLVELGLLERQVPFGRDPRASRGAVYRIADPFLRWWYRYLEPNRSRLAAGQVADVAAELELSWPHHLGSVWGDLCRRATATLELAGHRWTPGQRWWDRAAELDVVALALDDPGIALVGEAKLALASAEAPRVLARLRDRAARCPELAGKRVEPVIFALRGPGVGPEQVVEAC